MLSFQNPPPLPPRTDPTSQPNCQETKRSCASLGTHTECTAMCFLLSCPFLWDTGPGLQYAFKLPNHSVRLPELHQSPALGVWLPASRWLTSGCFISSNLDFFFFSLSSTLLPSREPEDSQFDCPGVFLLDSKNCLRAFVCTGTYICVHTSMNEMKKLNWRA